MRIVDREFGPRPGFGGSEASPPPPTLTDFILTYGNRGLDALDHSDEQTREIVEQLIAAGLLEHDWAGRLRPTPQALRGMESRILLDVMRDLRPKPPRCRSGPIQFVEPADALKIPIAEPEPTGLAATAVLLDLSGSMRCYGRYVHAKRLALALNALVRRQSCGETLHFIGFASTACVLRPDALPLIVPEPNRTRSREVRLRIPLDQAACAPKHFTNIHHALRLARSILSRSEADTRRILLVTDGQPSAHIERGTGGVEMLYLMHPPADRTIRATLSEAARCREAGIALSTYALIEQYHSMGWVGFVERLTRQARGEACYCTAADLPGVVLESWLADTDRHASAG